MKQVCFVIDPKGKIWNDTVAANERDCQVRFAKCFLGGWNVAIDQHLAWQIWAPFERIGFKIETLELPAK